MPFNPCALVRRPPAGAAPQSPLGGDEEQRLLAQLPGRP